MHKSYKILTLLIINLYFLSILANGFVIFQTTDSHSYIQNKDYKGEYNGLLHVAAIIKSHKCSKNKNLWIDCGDTISGTYEAYQTQGKLPFNILDKLGCDFFIPGNHEFDFGVKEFYDIYKLYEHKFLACNLHFKIKNKIIRPKAWDTITIDGQKIAIIGATRDYISNSRMALEDPNCQACTTSILSVLPKVLAEVIKAKPDFIILAIHNGKETGNSIIKKIAQNHPEINLILGGHTHINEAGVQLYPRTWFVQAPFHGKGVSKLEVTLQKNKKHKVESKIIFVDENKVDLEELDSNIAKTFKDIERNKNKTILKLNQNIDSRGTIAKNCLYTEIIYRAYTTSTKADAAFIGRTKNIKLKKGNVSNFEFYNFISYDNAIILADLTQKEIEEMIIEFQKSSKSSVYYALHGIHWKFENNKANITPAKEKKRYTIAMESYLASGAGRRFPIVLRILKNPDVNLRLGYKDHRVAILEWLQKNPNIQKPTSWKK